MNIFFVTVTSRNRYIIPSKTIVTWINTSLDWSNVDWRGSALHVVNKTVETFECKICLSNVAVQERAHFRECTNRQHDCCIDCTRYWIKERVESGHVFSLSCSRRAMVDCSAHLTDDEVLQFSDIETFRKYQRFKMMREDDTIRECPQCGHLCRPQMLQGEINAEMICPQCRCNFCYYHSNAHAGRPCDEYSRQISKQMKEMESGALADTKQCPKCGVHTVKTSGCNHMTCVERTCRAHWCWVCGQEIEGGADGVMRHYSTGECQQFPDIDETTTPGPFFWALRVVMFPFRLLFVLLASLIFILCMVISPLTLLTVSFSACFCCNRLRLKSQIAIKAFLLIPGFLLYVGIALIWMLLVCFSVGIFLSFFMPIEQFSHAWCGCPLILSPHVDRTHVFWLLALPFNALDPVRYCLQCYFSRCLNLISRIWRPSLNYTPVNVHSWTVLVCRNVMKYRDM